MLVQASQQMGCRIWQQAAAQHPDLKHEDMSRLDMLADRCLWADYEPQPLMVKICARASELQAVAWQQNASLPLACSPGGPWLLQRSLMGL